MSGEWCEVGGVGQVVGWGVCREWHRGGVWGGGGKGTGWVRSGGGKLTGWVLRGRKGWEVDRVGHVRGWEVDRVGHPESERVGS